MNTRNRDLLTGPIYKYSMLQHSKALADQGSVKVGTFFEYRTAEVRQRDVQDPDDGTKEATFLTPGSGYNDFSDMPPDLRQMMFPDEASARMVVKDGFMKGCVWQTERRAPHGFLVYCMSSEFNREAMLRMGYDSCVRIEDPVGFIETLGTELYSQGLTVSKLPVAFDKCRYRGKEEIRFREDEPLAFGSGPMDPSLMLRKEPRFAYQTEVRAVWPSTHSRPDLQQLKPAPFSQEKLADFCWLYHTENENHEADSNG